MEEQNPVVTITMTGTSTIDKHYYNWGCNSECLFYKGKPICFKVHGAILTRKDSIAIVKPFFPNMNITSYIFEDDIRAYEYPMKKAIQRFISSAKNAEWLDDIYLGLINTLNCKFEDRYLNYCKTLGPEKFREVTTKHAHRRVNNSLLPLKSFDGLWYR